MRFYSHLSDDERDQIAILRAAGRSMGAIARALGRAKTTISRELQRNALPSGGYSPLHAAGAYQLRRRREAILEREAALRLFVRDRLAEGWTPEQISGWLKSGNEPRLRAIGCETIYAFIYRTAQKAEALWRYLTRRHKRRRPRRARPSRDTIKDRASIHDRPKTIESRSEAGHWRRLIICKCTALRSSCMSYPPPSRALILFALHSSLSSPSSLPLLPSLPPAMGFGGLSFLFFFLSSLAPFPSFSLFPFASSCRVRLFFFSFILAFPLSHSSFPLPLLSFFWRPEQAQSVSQTVPHYSSLPPLGQPTALPMTVLRSRYRPRSGEGLGERS